MRLDVTVFRLTRGYRELMLAVAGQAEREATIMQGYQEVLKQLIERLRVRDIPIARDLLVAKDAVAFRGKRVRYYEGLGVKREDHEFELRKSRALVERLGKERASIRAEYVRARRVARVLGAEVESSGFDAVSSPVQDRLKELDVRLVHKPGNRDYGEILRVVVDELSKRLGASGSVGLTTSSPLSLFRPDLKSLRVALTAALLFATGMPGEKAFHLNAALAASQPQRAPGTHFIPLAPKDNGRVLKNLLEGGMAGYQMSVGTWIWDLSTTPRSKTSGIHSRYPEVIEAMSDVANAALKAYHASGNMEEAKNEALKKANIAMQQHGVWLKVDLFGLFLMSQEGRIPNPSPAAMVLDFTIFRWAGHFAVTSGSGRQFQIAYIKSIPGQKLTMASYLRVNPQELASALGATRQDKVQPLSEATIKELLNRMGHDASEAQALSLARALANQEAQRQVLLEAGLKPQTPEHQTLVLLAALTGEQQSALRALELMVLLPQAPVFDSAAQSSIMEQLASLRHIAPTQPQEILVYYQRRPQELKTDALEIRANEMSQLRASGFKGKIDFVVDEDNFSRW